MSLNRLPRELRDAIYDYYTFEDGGYSFDSRTGKLCTSSGNKIDLSLMYTCKAVASEMRGVPLKNNAVHFKTSLITVRCTPRTRHFGNLLEELYSTKFHTLSRARPLITDAIAQRIKELFPQSAKLIQHLRTTKAKTCRNFEHLYRSEEWCMVPSFHRDAVSELLRMVATAPTFSQTTRRTLLQEGFKFREDQDVQEFYSLNPPPWCLPSEHEVAALERHMPSTPPWPVRERVRDHTRYYNSAASHASKFLSHLPPHIRTCIRRIELHEQHASIAYPECHSKALIPYAIENPILNIVRRVDLWNTVLASKQLSHLERHRCGHGGGRTPLEDIDGIDITRTISPWLVEALALAPAGMPVKAFSLVFEGEAKSMQLIFDMLIEDASWQDALQQWPGRHLIPLWKRERNGTGYKSYYCYFSDNFPEMMKNVIKGIGPVRFDNVHARAWDAEKFVLLNSDCHGMQDWWLKWKSLRLLHFVPPPLPRTWHAILKEYVCEIENTT